MDKKLEFGILALAGILVLTACTPAVQVPEPANSSQVADQPQVKTSSKQSGNNAVTSSGVSYPVVDTNQDDCFDEASAVSCPVEGETYFGQDAQYSGIQPAYQDNDDGTVTDLNTGLTWIQDAGEKVGYYEGVEIAAEYEFAGYDDWRLPTIKELYSLMDFSGIDDADAGTDPFIDDSFFVFEYGDTSKGDRAIDSQWMTSTVNVDTVMGNQECFFGVNFADGRIKCYPTRAGGNNGYFMRLVRGGNYGENQFNDNGDSTILDTATGLTWQQDDSGAGMDWPDALAYCEDLSLGGNDDWRLPNAKELQSIVDYTRSPGTTDSAAIDPVFNLTGITNEAGQDDYGFYWTSTTHEGRIGGGNAVYISFGRALGYFQNQWMDVHGAGAQRSDPKTGDPADYPTYFGPQGDASRLYNYVRCVSGGTSGESLTGGEVDPAKTGQGQQQRQGQQNGGGAQQGDRPLLDLASAAAQLGVSEQALREALGDPGQGPPDMAAAAAILGVSEADLIAVLGLPGGGPPAE